MTSSPSITRSRSSDIADRELRLLLGHRGDEREQERRSERDRLDAAEREARDEAGRRERGVRERGAGRCSRSCLAARSASSAGGVGTVSSASSTTSSPRSALHPELGAQHQPVRERRHRDRLHVLGSRRSRVRRAPPSRATASAARGCRAGSRRPRAAATRASPSRGRRCSPRSRRRRAPARARAASRRASRASTTGSSSTSSTPRSSRRSSISISCSRPGSRSQIRTRNRSSCASGSGYVPSYSIGFCVASTRNGGSSRCVVALDRHLALLHRLEQRGLRLRRGAVDLVGEQEVGEDRAGAEDELGRPLVEDLRAGDVGGHQVRRELDARETERGRLRERARDQRLREPG